MSVAKQKETGKSGVVVAMGDAVRDLMRQRRRRKDPLPHLPRGPNNDIYPARKGKPPSWTPNNLGLPNEEPCPVVPIGYEGNKKFFLDSDGTFRELTAKDLSHAGLQDLFSATPNYPQWAWPRYGKKPKQSDDDEDEDSEDAPPKPKVRPPIESFKDDDVRAALLLACSRKGAFSPTDKLRGRGAWALRGGQIVYHAGEELWTFENQRPKPLETGMHGEHLYPRLPALPVPWTETVTPDDNPAGDLLETLRKWNWERPEVDPLLMLGWIGVAYLGGALDWRSAVLLLGDRGTGKSTLQQGLRDVFGDALFHSSDTSAAGIYQKMRNDTRPVALDELEPGADPRKVDAVVTLMRDASSGAIGRRGGSDGSPSEFQMRSAFLFSAINNPLHLAQDVSRVAVLRLKPLEANQEPPPPIDADTCGRKILHVLMREWPRFDETFQAYRRALAGGGHVARGQDTYGTLLAAADLMLGPELADKHKVRLACTDEAAWWTDHLSAEVLPEIEDAKPNWRNCIDHLLTVHVDAWAKGKRQTIGKCLDEAQSEQHATADNTEPYNINHAKRDLADTGCGLETAGSLLDRMARALTEGGSKLPPEELYQHAAQALGLSSSSGLILAVPNKHPNVKKLFMNTDWASGSWKDAFRQCPLPGIVITDRRVNRVRIAGVQERCTLIVLDKYHGAPER